MSGEVAVIELKCIGCRHKQTDAETKLKSVGLWLCNRCGSVCVIVKATGSKKRGQGITQRLRKIFGAKCEEICRGEHSGTVRDATNGKTYDWFLTPSGVLTYGETT